MTHESPPVAQPTTGDHLRKRILTGLAAAAFGLTVFAVGAPLLQFAGLFIALVIAYEWSNIIRGTSQPSIGTALMLFGVGLGVSATGYGSFMFAAVGMGVMCALTALACWNKPVERIWLPLGIVYAGVPWSLLVGLYVIGGVGPWVLAIGLCVVTSADIAAYFAGKHLGGPKLAPKISPKKTWIGLLMGVTVGYIVAQVLVTWSPITAWKFALAAPAFALISQVSDLMESLVKRRFGVKDAGTLLPGHGGVMDRMDGMVLTSAALVLFCLLGWH